MILLNPEIFFEIFLNFIIFSLTHKPPTAIRKNRQLPILRRKEDKKKNTKKFRVVSFDRGFV